MKLEIEEAALWDIMLKALRYDAIIDALLREKFDKINIYTGLEIAKNYMSHIKDQQLSDIQTENKDEMHQS